MNPSGDRIKAISDQIDLAWRMVNPAGDRMKAIADGIDLTWRTVNPIGDGIKAIADGMSLAWRTVNPIGDGIKAIADGISLAWRTVNPIRDGMKAIPGWDQSRMEDSESDRGSDKSDPLSDRCRLEGRESDRASLQNARRYVKRNARATQFRTGGANSAPSLPARSQHSAYEFALRERVEARGPQRREAASAAAVPWAATCASVHAGRPAQETTGIVTLRRKLCAGSCDWQSRAPYF
jgi:hypothetical protein